MIVRGSCVAVAHAAEQIAVGLLFALGLVLGLSVAPVIADYAKADAAALWQATGELVTSALLAPSATRPGTRPGSSRARRTA